MIMGLSSKQVSSDGNGWNQALLEGSRTLEFPKTSQIMIKTQQQQQQDQQPPPPEQLNCPRCDSTNTKFCYYNNYNKSQPRHFCKACKRHWTKGGTLRNVPVGGGRKNKRLKITKPSSKTTTTTTTNNNNMGGTLHSQHIRAASLPLGGSFASKNSSMIEDKSFSEAFYHNFLKQQQHRSLPESSITFTSKGLNDGIYLDSTTMKTTSLGLSTQHHDHHQDNIQLFPYTNLLGSFDSNNNNNNNPCSISTTNTSIQSPSVYNFTSDNDHGNNDGLLENDHHQQHHPWTMHTSSTRNDNINVNSNININNNNVVDMMSSNYWGLDDFDKFVTVEADLTMPWDNEDSKP